MAKNSDITWEHIRKEESWISPPPIPTESEDKILLRSPGDLRSTWLGGLIFALGTILCKHHFYVLFFLILLVYS